MRLGTLKGTKPIYEGPPSNATTLDTRISTYEFAGGYKYSDHSTCSTKSKVYRIRVYVKLSYTYKKHILAINYLIQK